MNIAVIGIGSNIRPEENIQKAVNHIKEKYALVATSTFVITKPVGFKDQPDFVNGAVLIKTKSALELLSEELKKIEDELGRIRRENRSGPREIDLDIVVFNGEIVDEDVYTREFLRNSVEELLPELEIKK